MLSATETAPDREPNVEASRAVNHKEADSENGETLKRTVGDSEVGISFRKVVSGQEKICYTIILRAVSLLLLFESRERCFDYVRGRVSASRCVYAFRR